MSLQRLALCLLAGLSPIGASTALANCTIAAQIAEVNPDSAYVVHLDGTATDTRTGLTWKRCSEGQEWTGATCIGNAEGLTWTSALNQAANSAFAGYTDWRLPSQTELETLVETGCATAPSINTLIFPSTPYGVPTKTGTTLMADASSTWTTVFTNGIVLPSAKTYNQYVRLVRGGQSLGAYDANSAGNGLVVTSVNDASPPTARTPFDVVVASAANVTANTLVTLWNNTGTGILGGNTTCTIPNGTTTCTITGATWDTGESGIKLVANAEGFTSGMSSAFAVNKSSPTVALTSGSNPSTYGGSATFTATLNGGVSPTGTVDFRDNGSSIAGCAAQTVSLGEAVCWTVALAAGSHANLTAVYSGDAANNGATSSALSQTVNVKALTISGLTANNKPYDGTLAASLAGTAGLSGIVGSDDVSLTGTLSASFLHANAGNGKTVAVSGLSLAGTTKDNYSLTPLYLSASILQVGQGITFNPPGSGVVGQHIGLTGSGGASENPVTFAVQSGACHYDNPNVILDGVGDCVVRASQAGNVNYSAATPVDRTIRASKASVTLSIDSVTPTPSTVGESVMVTFTIQPVAPSTFAPTGNITVSDGTESCDTSIMAATNNCSLISSSAGAKTLVASYAGNDQFNGGSSTGVSHSVNAIGTSTAVSVVNPSGQSNTGKTATSVYGQTVTVTVEVTAASGVTYPPGTVDVTVNGKTCQVALSDQTGGVAGGQCTLNAGSGYPDVGASQAVAASYTPGNSNFAASSSSGASNGSLTVIAADTATSLTTTPVNSTAGGNVDLVATISAISPSGANPSGTVDFSADGNPIATCAGAQAVIVDINGKATCATSFAMSGIKTIAAAFTGNTNFNDSDSGSESHTVNRANSTTTILVLSPAAGPYSYGNGLSVTAGVTGAIGSPTGSITVAAGSASCSAELTAGEATCTLYPPAGSPITLSVTYNGDAIYGGSDSSLPITVTQVAPAVSLTPTPSPSTVGDGVTLNVTVARPNASSLHPTGTVAVKNGAAILCTTGNLVNGQASCAHSFAATGNYSLTAEYAGDANYQGNSGTASHDVQVASTATAITLITPNPATYGQAVTVNVTVTGNATLGAPSGTVILSGAGSCTATLSASTATQSTGSCQPTGLNAGTSQTLSATYSGDAVYGGSTANGSLTVNKASATVDLGNLGPHTYDTTQKSATCATTPDVAHLVEYSDAGSGTGRINVGSYGVTCTVTDPNYTGSDSGTLSISQATQSISFGPLASKTYGDPPFTVSATVPASGAVAIASTTAGVCTLVDHANGSATVTLVGTGACSLRASHSGDANYQAAPDNDQGFSVGTLNLSPSLGNLGPHVYDGLAKAASCVTVPAGLSVSLTYNGSAYSPSNVGVYSVACTITQAGYAGSASGSLNIVKAGQTITFNALANRLYGSGNFTLTATAGSGLPVSYASATPSRCTVNGSTVTLVAVGTCTLNADQAGNSNWNAATQVSRSFAINAPAPAPLPDNSGPAPGGAGSVNVTGNASGTAPNWNKFQFIPVEGHADSPPSGSVPLGEVFPFGLFDFVVNGIVPGSTLVLNMTYPSALHEGAVYWKYGPTANNPTAHWYIMPVVISVDRRTVTLTIVDGGLGDDDLAPNGTVVDQGGPAVSMTRTGSQSIPTLNEWGMIVLSLMLMAVAWMGRRGYSLAR